MLDRMKAVVEAQLARGFAGRARGGAPRDVAGRNVVITGGAGGLGRAFAEAFSTAGARIALLDLNAEALDAAAKDLSLKGVQCETFRCDITREPDCEAALGQVRERLGAVEILINNAGITHIGVFGDAGPADVRRVMDVNVFGAVNVTYHALEDLKRTRGAIVAVSSVAGIAPLFGRTGYAASKHALHGFYDTLRCELAEHGVDVTLLCPSMIATDMRRLGGKTPDFDSELQSQKMVTPGEVASALLGAVRSRARLVLVGENSALGYGVHFALPKLYDRMMMKRYAPATRARIAAVKGDAAP